MATWTKREVEEARKELREKLKPGDTVFTRIEHVSRSGMLRTVSCYIMDPETCSKYGPSNVSRLVAKALADSFDDKKYAIRVSGCGFSAEFNVVHRLGYQLWPDGFTCTGAKDCPSNDHNNGDRDYTPHNHSSGGYSLKQRSL